MKNYRKLYGPLAAVILILLDQLSKQWIVNHIPLNAIRKCVPGIFSLTYLRNYGAAFSIFAESAVVLYGDYTCCCRSSLLLFY